MYTEYARSLLEDVGILKMESVVLHNNITIIPHSVLNVSLSYYIINLCISASSNFNGSFFLAYVII